MLWVRSMEQVAAKELVGTEDAQDPFWSLDGRWIGFFATGKLKKILAGGGLVQVLAENTTDLRGGAWGREDTILLGSGGGPMLRMSSEGGKPAPLTITNASQHAVSDRNPSFLPDGLHFLYTVLSGLP